MLCAKIQSDLKDAQLNREEVKVATLRLLWSELHYAEIEKGRELSDEETIAVIRREIKKRKEAAEGFQQGGREEAALKEEAEAAILVEYLPAQLSDLEIGKIIDEVIQEAGGVSPKDIGRVMGAVFGKVAGRADGGRVSSLVKLKLKG